MKRWIKIALILCTIILLLTGGVFLSYHLFFDPNRECVTNAVITQPLDSLLTKDQAKEDLSYLMKCLRSFNPIYIDGSEDLVQLVEDQYKIEINNLPDEISVNDLWRAACRITAKMHIGHCNVYVDTEDRYISSLRAFHEYELLKVNGIPLADLLKTFVEQFSFEIGMEAYAEETFKKTLISERYLKFIGIDTSKGVDFTYQTNSGKSTTHYDFVTADQVIWDNLETNDFVHYKIDKENSTGVFTLNKCNPDDTYLKVLDEFFSEVEHEQIQNVIVDLRENGGGNSYVVIEFMEYIDVDSYCLSGGRDMRYGPFLKHGGKFICKNKKKANVFQGDLYVMTSPLTYSSAMDFAVAVADNHIGTIVGEVPGNMPTCYTDIKEFQMKNSKLMFIIPWKKIYRPDSTKLNEPLIPDYVVDQEDALNKVYELINSK